MPLLLELFLWLYCWMFCRPQFPLLGYGMKLRGIVLFFSEPETNGKELAIVQRDDLNSYI